MWAVNWSGLLFASRLLLWLSISVTVLYVGLMTGLNIVEMLSTRFGSGSFTTASLNWRMRSAKARRLVNRWTPRLGMMVLGYVLGQAQIFSPITEFHNVEVISQNGPRRFTVLIPGKDQVPQRPKDQEDTLLLCAWGDDLPLKPGMVMTILQYKQQKDCQLIDSQTEVKYLNDEHHNVVDKQGHILFAKENN